MDPNIFQNFSKAQVKALQEKWAPNLEAVKEAKNGLEDEKAFQLALVLENTYNAFVRSGALSESTQPADLTGADGLKRYYFDIVTAVLPNLISQDLVSVQPIAQKVAQVFFLRYLYGTKKGKISAGDEMVDPRYGWGASHSSDTVTQSGVVAAGVNPASRPFKQALDYSSETVTEEKVCDLAAGSEVTYGTLGTHAKTGTVLSWRPVRPGTVHFLFKTADNSTWYDIGPDVDAGNGFGYFTNPAGGPLSGSGSTTVNCVKYATGDWNLTISGGTRYASVDIMATYEFNNETTAVGGEGATIVPEINIKIDTTTVTARSRKLKALYAFDTAFDIRMQHGIDIDDALLQAVSNEILHELDGEICNDLLYGATKTVTWNKYPAAGIQWHFHKESFIDEIIVASNTIFQYTQRAVGNFIVLGTDASNVLESIGSPRFVGNGAGKAMGPHFAGTLDGKYKCYKNPYYERGKFCVGYKGDLFLDAGYVLAPYLPVFATQLIMAEDFQGRRGFATSNGKKMLNPYLYVSGTVGVTSPQTNNTAPGATP